MTPLLIFDLDGTLIDSAPDIIRAVNLTLTRHGKSELDDQTIISHIGEGLKKLISDIFSSESLSAETVTAIELEFLETYRKEMLRDTKIFPGVESFLTNYKGAIAIVTNKNEAPAKAIINHLGLNRFPWLHIFGADTLAERKPSPLPLQTVMNLTGHTPETTFMIGDGTPDMLSAQRARVPAIAVEFGYTKAEILNSYSPRASLVHYDQLAPLLLELAQA